MTRYLISFPSATMKLHPDEFDAVVESSHRVIRDAQAAGVYVFSGGINEAVPPVLVHADGTTSPQTSMLDGGFCVPELATRAEAEHWAARLAEGCRTPQELREFQYDPEA